MNTGFKIKRDYDRYSQSVLIFKIILSTVLRCHEPITEHVLTS